jgi:hypothetical protein
MEGTNVEMVGWRHCRLLSPVGDRQGPPFKDLGIRLVPRNLVTHPAAPLGIEDVELIVPEFSGTSRIQEFMKGGNSTNQRSLDNADQR